MVSCVEAVTALVLTVKGALLPPAGTVTLGGTVAAGALLERYTVAPLVAGPLSVTVPVDEVPPVMLDGLTPTDKSVGDSGGGLL